MYVLLISYDNGVLLMFVLVYIDTGDCKGSY